MVLQILQGEEEKEDLALSLSPGYIVSKRIGKGILVGLSSNSRILEGFLVTVGDRHIVPFRRWSRICLVGIFI